MHETFEFKSAGRSLESRLASLILFERMQFSDVKMPTRSQNPARLRKNEIKVFDVFERERASHQIESVRRKIPIFAQIETPEFDVIRRDFFFRFGKHFRRKIHSDQTFGFRCEPFGVFPVPQPISRTSENPAAETLSRSAIASRSRVLFSTVS